MTKSLTVTIFKKRFEISQRELNRLIAQGRVKKVQSGYRGHSLAHPRLIVFADNLKIRNHRAIIEELGQTKPVREYCYFCNKRREVLQHPRSCATCLSVFSQKWYQELKEMKEFS